MEQVYWSVGWKKHTVEVIEKIFIASNVFAISSINGQVVGLGRAISDGVFNAAIYDVVVHKDFQGRGIGDKIMNSLLEQLSDISCVHLISTTGNEHFYYKHAFKNVKTGMARYINVQLQQKYLN
ncbi:GNAT family N-acetyltransferase [Bacillus carboniphilus]|uniref:GNAT family N-acetyltransferase n=1 Tax=Bacillus carboniphilus TaxID=86663 RepID=A0ABY9K102_9BACI|nr:GNAT family N-acetyltransferase [Bacillus carboniphilus]WLR44268.1 GNAT family N-acetyltransferase [Bacillus carboniphilus]